MKLICLHFAGGNGYFYYKWKKHLPEIEVVPIDLPGHGSKINQELLYCFDDAVTSIYNELIDVASNGKDYVIFGHSMGGIFIPHILKRLEKMSKLLPMGVIISGACPPNVERIKEKKFTEISDDELVDRILEMGGTDKNIVRTEEFKNYFLPIIKADYAILSNHEYLNVSLNFLGKVAIFNGNEDTIPLKFEKEWAEYFGKIINIKHFMGRHLYLMDNEEKICSEISAFIKENGEGCK